MATDAAKFFEAEQPAAILKHGILSRYLRPFVQKTGKRSKDGRVAYIDGYAGPGQYEDGSIGSPAVAVDAASVVVDSDGDGRIDGYFVERDHDSVGALRRLFVERGVAWPVFHGDVQEHLPEIVANIHSDQSLFAFLDPFGLGIPLDMIESQLLARAGPLKYGYRVEGAPTEVLLNFSFPGLRRNAGHLTSEKDYKARDTIVAKLDRTLGGDWWHDIWRSGDPDREEKIRAEYVKRVTALPGNWGVYTVDISNQIGTRPVYSLLLMTQHPDGVWLFNNAVSSSIEEWRTACYEQSGEMDFEPLKDREAAWVEEIKRSMIERLEVGPFAVGRHVKQVYGSALGLAREKHVRVAMKALYKDGTILHHGVGDIATASIKKPS